MKQALNGSVSDELSIVARESIYIYGANLIASATGFLYWVLAAKLVSSNVLGTSSTIVILSSITIALSTLGLTTAILRVGSMHRDEISRVACTALVMNLVTTTMVTLGGLTIYARILGSTWLALLVVPLALAGAPTLVLRPVLITTRNAKYLSYAQILSAASRIGLGIVVLLTAPTITAVVTGYLLGSLTVTVTLLAIILRRKLLEPYASRIYATELLRAGIPIWLPNTIAVLGTQLAVVFTYSIRGGSEAGYLYIAQTIALAIDAARVAVASALIPSIASGNLDKKRLGDVIRLVFALLLPVNMALFFFPEPILRLINPEYLAAINPLRIYILANTVLLMVGLVATHIYASGNYRYTLLINTSVSTTRVTLYTILTPIYGATGAATAYLAGTLTATTLIVSKTRGVKAPWNRMILSLATTAFLGITLKHLVGETTLASVVAIIVYLLLVYLICIAFKILRETELIQLLGILKSIARIR